MNKKNLLVAAALPLFVAACSSEDVLVESQSVDQFEGIAKVDAKFNLSNSESRLATEWGIEAGKDILGFAWLGTKNHGGEDVDFEGKAIQNHPLFAASAGSFQPETSIYVGKYYTYHPYDYSTKQISAVNFTLAGQDMIAGYEGTAAKSIWISPKWTNVTLVGNPDDGTDKAGVDESFNIYPRKFTNDANLMMTFTNNNPSTGTPEIKNIKVSYWNGATEVSVNSFTYAPTVEHYSDIESAPADFWKNYTLIAGTTTASAPVRAANPQSVNGVTATNGPVVLNPSVDTYAEGARLQVSYNSLPASAEITPTTQVKVEIETTYGKITYPNAKTVIENNKTMYLNQIAKTRKDDGTWAAGRDGELAEDGTLLGVPVAESFVQNLYKTGRFDFTVDFFDAIMNGMHVEDNAELMKMLTYYKLYKVDTDYEENIVNLYLDGDDNGEFKISKKALALVQEINQTANLKLYPCDIHGTTSKVAIVVFNEEDAEDEAYKEVPTFNTVFDEKVNIYLDNQAWTWNSDAAKNTGFVKNIYNRGQLEINAGIVATTSSKTQFSALENTTAGTITVKSVANVKVNMINKGQINIKPNAELLAYGKTITNEATSLTAYGKVDNDGVFGVVEGTNGVINNYGYIHNDAAAKTYITNNETNGAAFANAWSSTNKIGTIELSDKFDNISVSNATNEGFIKYTWDGAATYSTPTPIVDVKYNYLIVKNSLAFTEVEEEIKFVEIANTGNEIVLTAVEVENGYQGLNLTGFVMQEGAKVNIKKGNKVTTTAAYISNSRVYVGGEFDYKNQLTSYLTGSADDTDFIVIY